jgi:hypothetical protein
MHIPSATGDEPTISKNFPSLFVPQDHRTKRRLGEPAAFLGVGHLARLKVELRIKNVQKGSPDGTYCLRRFQAIVRG